MSSISNKGHNVGYLGNSPLDFCVARGLPLVSHVKLFTVIMLVFSLDSPHFCFQ